MSRYDALDNFYMVKEANSRAKDKKRKAARRAKRAQQAPAQASAARGYGDQRVLELLKEDRKRYDANRIRNRDTAVSQEAARRRGMNRAEYRRLQNPVPANMLPARMSDTSMATTQATTRKAPKKLRASYTNTPSVAPTARQIGYGASSSASSSAPTSLMRQSSSKPLSVGGSPSSSSSAASSAAKATGGMSNLAKGGIAAGVLGLGGAYLHNRNRQQRQR